MQETQEMQVPSLRWEDPLKANHSSILAWRIPWTEKPGGIYGPWGHKESDMTEHTHAHTKGVCPLLPPPLRTWHVFSCCSNTHDHKTTWGSPSPASADRAYHRTPTPLPPSPPNCYKVCKTRSSRGTTLIGGIWPHPQIWAIMWKAKRLPREHPGKWLSRLAQGSPTSGTRCLTISGGADVIIIEIKCTLNATQLHYPQTTPPSPVHGEENCLPWNSSLGPQRLGHSQRETPCVPSKRLPDWASLELSPSVESCGCGLGPSPVRLG